MSKDTHGLFGGIIKILMVIIFTLIGIAVMVFGIIGLTALKASVPTWIAACNVAFGACLLLSPFFLSHKRVGFNKVIKVLLIIVFVLIGILFIVSGALGLSVYKADYKDMIWYPIVTLVFGCLLFTSPFFLRKSL